MAKRKTKKKVTRRRRRSSVGGVDFTTVIAAVVGGVGSRFLNKIIPATINPKVVSASKILVGAAIPMFSKKAKTKQMLTAVGTGMAVEGTIDLLKGFGVLNGLGIDEDEEISVVLSGDDIAILNQDEDDMSILNADEDIIDDGEFSDLDEYIED